MRDVSRHMKTGPILRADGSVFAFEIPPSFFTQWPLTRLLRSIEGVGEVEAPWYSLDVRLAFTFQGEPCVVKNDSDRYWIGPANVHTSKLDLTPVHRAFQAQRHSALRRWAVDFDTSDHGGLAPGEAFAVAVVACFGYISVLDSLPSSFLPSSASPVLGLSLVLLTDGPPALRLPLLSWRPAVHQDVRHSG